MRVMKLLSACASLWLLTGCAASVHPLCDPATAEPDKRLVGMWERRDGNDAERVSYLHIAREARRPLDTSRAEPEPGLMRCWATGHDEKSLLGDDAGGGRSAPSMPLAAVGCSRRGSVTSITPAS